MMHMCNRLAAVAVLLASPGAIAQTFTLEQFAELIRTDAARWAKVIRDAGVKADGAFSPA
jgi:hypothetical protein